MCVAPCIHIHIHDNKHFKHSGDPLASSFCLMQRKSQEYFVFGFLDHIVYFEEFVIIAVTVAAVALRFMVIFILTRSGDKNTHRRLEDAASNV